MKFIDYLYFARIRKNRKNKIKLYRKFPELVTGGEKTESIFILSLLSSFYCIAIIDFFRTLYKKGILGKSLIYEDLFATYYPYTFITPIILIISLLFLFINKRYYKKISYKELNNQIRNLSNKERARLKYSVWILVAFPFLLGLFIMYLQKDMPPPIP